MKKLLLLSILPIFFSLSLCAQPQAFKYSAVALGPDGQPVAGDICVRFTMHEDGENGPVRYVESHQATANDNGKFSLEVGRGTPSPDFPGFDELDWANHQYWMRVALSFDCQEFNTYGVSQLLSVPYALYAHSAGQSGDDDPDPTNEIQQLSRDGNLITLSNGGGSVTDQVDDADNDPGNEIQQLSRDGNLITLSNGGGSVTDQVDDADNDPANEIQQLTLDGNNLSLSRNGGAVALPGGISEVIGGIGITASPAGTAVTIDAQTDTAIWNADRLRGRKINGMAPNNARVFYYDPNGDNGNGGYDFAADGSDVAVTGSGVLEVQALRGRKINGMAPNNARVFYYDPNGDNGNGGYDFAADGSDVAVTGSGVLEVQALRGRKINGMAPNNARVFVYDPGSDNGNGGYDFAAADSDITVEVDAGSGEKSLTVSRIRSLPVDFSGGIGAGMVLTCTDGPGGLQFECLPSTGGFSLPFSQSVNLSTAMFSITNTNSITSNLVGMQVDNQGRYGIRGISREGQGLFNPFSVLENRSFTYPAAIYGEHLNTSPAMAAGAGVLGKAVSGSENEGIGGIFMGNSLGVLAVGYSGGGGALLAYGAGGADAGWFVGDVTMEDRLEVYGSVNSVVKNFQIDHPQDPANKYLYHTSVESPDMKNIYDGIVTTDTEGYATVELPGYFGSLNKDCRYQLTCIGQFAQAIIAQKVENNRFVIRTDKPNVEVSWQVAGIRKDPYAEAHRTVPEVEKPAEEKGTYINPELYGQPREKKLGWDRINREF